MQRTDNKISEMNTQGLAHIYHIQAHTKMAAILQMKENQAIKEGPKNSGSSLLTWASKNLPFVSSPETM